MARNTTKTNQNALKQVFNLNAAAKKILGTLDPSYSEKELLSRQDAKIQKIIDEEFEFSRGVANGSILDFTTSLMKNGNAENVQEGKTVDSTSLFTQNIGNVFGYFKETYKTRYIELADLKFISKFIPAIGEAVKVTLDAITNADDISSTLSRNLVFPSDLTDAEKATVENEIHRMEKEYKLLSRLKNVVYKKTLVTGNFYVYHAAYKDLFEEYSRMKADGKFDQDNPLITRNLSEMPVSAKLTPKTSRATGFNIKGANESVITIDGIMESFGSDFTPTEKESIRKSLDSANLASVFFDDSVYLEEGLEGAAVLSDVQNHLDGYVTHFDGVRSTAGYEVAPDGTMDMDEAKRQQKRHAEKFELTGTYIKYIDAKNMIPIRIYDQIVGYYHVHNTVAKKRSAANGLKSNGDGFLTINNTVFSATNLSEQKKKDAVQTIVDTISDAIVSQFSSSFVSKNAEFKQLIADCIIANGFVDNEFHIQFIPANFVTEFVINEDENGNGESILADALFPAKMLLSLIVSKMLNYMNKGGNKTIAYLKKGPLDLNSSNQVQRVLRAMSEANISFNDLLSSQMIFSKFTRDANIQMPTARNGDRLVDFEIQEGQNIDMTPDFETWLEKLAVLGTGVPSVMMEYVDVADYSRSIVNANIKFAGRVSCLDSDLEAPTTEFYKTLIRNSSLEENLKEKVLRGFEFKLVRPKVLSNTNNSEYLQQLKSMAETMADITVTPDVAAQDDIEFLRALVIKDACMKNSPTILWKEYEESLDQALLALAKSKKLTDDSISTDNSSGSELLGDTSDIPDDEL